MMKTEKRVQLFIIQSMFDHVVHVVLVNQISKERRQFSCLQNEYHLNNIRRLCFDALFKHFEVPDSKIEKSTKIGRKYFTQTCTYL